MTTLQELLISLDQTVDGDLIKAQKNWYARGYKDYFYDINTNTNLNQKKQSFLLDVHCPSLAKRCINVLVGSSINNLLKDSLKKHESFSEDGIDTVRYNSHNYNEDIRNVLCNLDGKTGESVSFYICFFTLLALVMDNVVNEDWETSIDNLRTFGVADLPKEEKELCLLFLLASSSHTKTVTVDSVKLTLQDCDQLVALSLSSQHLVFIASVLYQMSKGVEGESKLVLLRECFLVLNYSHIVDPSNSELPLILVGETLVQNLKQNNHPKTKPSKMLLDFVLKRLITCNLVPRKQFAQIYVNQLCQNIESKFKYPNTVFNERDFSINEKAHRLAWIYKKVIENDCEEKLDQVEGVILLMNSLHNFNMLLSELNNKEGIDTSFPTSSNIWLENGEMNCFNVKAYYFAVDALYSIMLKSNPCPPLRHIKSLETHFPYILITQSLTNLKKLAEVNEFKPSKPESFGNLDFLPISSGERMQIVISEMITLLHSGWCYETEKLPKEVSKLESIDEFVSNNVSAFDFV